VHPGHKLTGPEEEAQEEEEENYNSIKARDRYCTITYLLTPWSRVLLEKLIGLQLVKKFPAFYRARRFLTAHTSARHLSLS
jgi:hypothetical protein